MRGQGSASLGAVAALFGVVLLLLSTLLHPLSADPNDPAAAFTEYAADSIWVWTHLGQFAGFAVLGVAMLALGASLEVGRATAWARTASGGAVAIVALAAALQAVDGVALKVMVDRWASATGDARTLAFESAFAVRQIEIGLASLLSLVSGLTLIVFGVAILRSGGYPAWFGWIGLVGGAGTLAARRPASVHWVLGARDDAEHAVERVAPLVGGRGRRAHVAARPGGRPLGTGRGEPQNDAEPDDERKTH